MKKPLYLLILFTLSLSLHAAEWTVMMYFSGDNNLSSILKTQIEALEQLEASDQVNLLIQFDGDRVNDSKRLIIRGQTEVVEQDLEYDMGDIETLANFVDWGMRHFPAKKYSLIINGHGRGILNLPVGDGGGATLTMASSPDSSEGSVINEEEMAQRLSAVLGGKKFDLLIYSACLMGNLETLITISPIAKYVIASEFLIYLDDKYKMDTVLGEGISLRRMMELLNHSPQVEALEVGQNLLEFYQDSYQFFQTFDLPGMSHYEEASLALYDLDQAESIKQQFKTVLNAIKNDIDKNRYDLDQLYLEVLNAPKVNELGYIDLGQLLLIFQKIKPTTDLNQLIDDLFNDDRFIVGKKILNLPENTLGVSIYFPTERPSYGQDNFQYLLNSYQLFEIDQELQLSSIILNYLEHVERNKIRLIQEIIFDLLETNNEKGLNEKVIFSKMDVYLMNQSKLKVWFYYQRIKRSKYSSYNFTEHKEYIQKLLKK